MMKAKNLIILCATQRCGSTMVVEDMRNTGVLGNPEEYFIPWNPQKIDVNWLESLEGISQKASTENDVVCIKVMANQLPSVNECLKQAWGEKNINLTGDYPYFRALTKNASYVFLRRDSIVRQAISREMSRQTGVNHATKNSSDDHFAGNLMKGYSSSYNEKVTFRESSLSADVISIVRENTTWENYFTSWSIKNPLVLRYEEICKNSPSYLERIAKYSSIELETDLLPKKRSMVKLSNELNDKWCEKYTNYEFETTE